MNQRKEEHEHHRKHYIRNNHSRKRGFFSNIKQELEKMEAERTQMQSCRHQLIEDVLKHRPDINPEEVKTCQYGHWNPYGK